MPTSNGLDEWCRRDLPLAVAVIATLAVAVIATLAFGVIVFA